MGTRHWLSAAATVLPLGCGSVSNDSPGAQSAPEIENPTGGCQAPDDGSRIPYHSAGTSTWLMDCKNVLKREYWRVFATSNQSAGTIPRLDGSPALQSACHDSQHPLARLVMQYPLCSPASTSAQVEAVNNMLPADALTLTHHLHTELRFEVVPDAMGIAPYPLPNDILDACALRPSAHSTEFAALCQRERDRANSGHDIGLSYTGPGAEELVALLNELYGIGR